MKTLRDFLLLYYALFLLTSCKHKEEDHDMLDVLDKTREKIHDPRNPFSSGEVLRNLDNEIKMYAGSGRVGTMEAQTFLKGITLLECGRIEDATTLFSDLLQDARVPPAAKKDVMVFLALSYLRSGEQTNCIRNHSTDACIFPIANGGIHKYMNGSKAAIEIYQQILKNNPKDLASKWLLNLAYMTLGTYPKDVPKDMLIPGLDSNATPDFLPFKDIGPQTGLSVKNMAGGVIVDDFDNDGYLDIVMSSMSMDSSMHYFKNLGNGRFEDLSVQSRLSKFTGGLNMMQTDYNNDGFKDIFVMRGGWQLAEFGEQPNSLLRNNGDGTFTDVTIQSGLLSFHPTQTATWNDFNNDGYLDVFIGNETSPSPDSKQHPCELYMNNRDGSFTEVAVSANCNVIAFVKGVASGDFDNDGWKDIFLSTMSGKRILLKNEGLKNGVLSFKDVTREAHLDKETNRSFPTWFWDFDNDGWLDIFVCDYTFMQSLGHYAAAEKLNEPLDNKGQPTLYRNNHDGTFTNITKEVGLYKTAFAMGSNFGDVDNDGYLDMYLGTGNPDYRSLVPDKMFRNAGGKMFEDVTTAAKVGSLQKGHGVAFADIDNDGDQDIFIEMGGAYRGDAYQSSLFLNPKRNNNNWICLALEGTTSNRAAIGTRVKLTITENGVTRNIYRDVNSGGSFGASPLRREIGIGAASQVDEIEIKWHGSGKVQVFKNVNCNQFIKIKEGSEAIEKLPTKSFDFHFAPNDVMACLPQIVVKKQ